MIASPPSLSLPQYSTAHILSQVLQACCTISILCSHSLQCGIIINSHLGEGCFPHHRMQWRFIATISKGLGEIQRMRERWKLCTYTTSFWVTIVWPCMSSEVDEKNNGWQMLRTVNEYLVIFGRQRGGGEYQGYAVHNNMCCEHRCKQWFNRCRKQSRCASNLTCTIWTKLIMVASAACVCLVCVHMQILWGLKEIILVVHIV